MSEQTLEERIANAVEKTIRMMERDGWAKGRDIGPCSEVCLWFGLQLAAGYDDVGVAAREVAAWLPRRYRRFSAPHALMLFNDRPWRRYKAVMDVLAKAYEAAIEGRLRSVGGGR